MNHESPEHISTREQLLARVAWLYYEQDLTQAEIGARLGLSRITVNRLLKEARQSGIVEIRIRPVSFDLPLVEMLLQRFSLQDAWLVPAVEETGEELAQSLAQMAALVLAQRLQEGWTVGIGISRTISYLPDFLVLDKPVNCRFATLMGGLYFRPVEMSHNFDILTRLAVATGGEAYYLPLPTFVSEPATREHLLADPLIQRSLNVARQADMAVFSVGTVDPAALLVQAGILGEEDLKELLEYGAVGDVLGYFFDRNGRLVPAAVHQRLLGISLEDLRRIPLKMLVAGGEPKRRAVHATLRSGLVDVLVTDTATARWLCDQKVEVEV
ncbi:sugar-binding transcriptional regulator [Bellilinea sp.]|jgi:DNA-binding transcriptional regulator LsrR (DeoR family)